MHCFRLALMAGALILIPPKTIADETAAIGVSIAQTNPVLVAFVQKVLATNSRVLASRSAYEAGEAALSAAEQPLYNPELSFDVENADSKVRALGISQTIDWSNKKRARVGVASNNKQLARAEYISERWRTANNLLVGLFRYRADEDRLSLARNRGEHMRTFLDLTQKRFDTGDLSQVELDLARLAAMDARLEEASTAARVSESRQSVHSLAPLVPVSDWPDHPDGIPVAENLNISFEALGYMLPELIAAQSRVKSAEATLDLRRREKRPDPILSLSGGKEDDETLIGLNLAIPLNIRNQFTAEVDLAAARHREAQQRYDDLLYGARARLSSAVERYELSSKALADWESTGQTSLDRQALLLQRLWQAGEISTTDYVVQISQVLDLQKSALDLRQTVWEAWFELLMASGHLDAWIDDGDLL